MASGLAALLDDVAAIAKVAAASLDDVGAAAGKASAKAAGVVIDDTAVTPRYVTGFTAERELPIIGRIALGSIKNKLLILLPVALLLSAFASWAITPILMLGGAYLCFEGAEKVLHSFGGHQAEAAAEVGDPAELERQKISGAIRTDLILSAEIMAIALAEVADEPFVSRAIILAVVALMVTVGVYGLVALIVKMDDIGLHLAQRSSALVQTFGRGLVKAMPGVLAFLSAVGIAAMIWVGGGIIVHGLHGTPLGGVSDWVDNTAHAIGHGNGLLEWAVHAVLYGIFGLILGALIAVIVGRFKKREQP